MISMERPVGGIMKKAKVPTYVSLFSSAGVGCYGFTKAGFECVATNEIVGRRLDIQRYNHKCVADSGYICADIREQGTKDLVFGEIAKWSEAGNDCIDVLVATPPCQGMSVANLKTKGHELSRNSLVVESVMLVRRIWPRFFVFENVPAFMKTGCMAPDGSVMAIGDMIGKWLGTEYDVASRVMNFKNYGSCSSRTRTLVIGRRRDVCPGLSPEALYPDYVEEPLLRDVIGDLPALSWGEINANDFYHAFRIYPDYMRDWIHGLKEGGSAFDNADPMLRPHRIIDGKAVPNVMKCGDKYKRQYWDRVAPCVHTRNDSMASQNTLHPSEDRVFSIRELMRMMSIPDDFRWVDNTLEGLNGLSLDEKRRLLKSEEIKIRQSIGEAVPTAVFYQVACKIDEVLAGGH